MKPLISAVLSVILIFLSMADSFSANVEERYAELQTVPEVINDPDPLRRLAALEHIIDENDATKVQLALRTAFTVDDPNIRAMALRAHFASYRTITIEAEFPDQTDDESINSKGNSNTVSFVNGVGKRINLHSNYERINETEFSFISLNFNLTKDDRLSGSGNIRGTTITLAGPIQYSNHTMYTVMCSFDFYRYDGFTVRGEGSCNMKDGFEPFPVLIRLF